MVEAGDMPLKKEAASPRQIGQVRLDWNKDFLELEIYSTSTNYKQTLNFVNNELNILYV